MPNTRPQIPSFFWNKKGPMTAGVIVFVVLLIISSYIVHLTYENEKKVEERNLSNIIQVIQQNIDHSLDNAKLAALNIALTLNDNGKPEHFEEVAHTLVKSYNSIDAVQLVPNGVIQYVYPYEENKSVIGYDILNDSTRNAEAFKAIALRKMFFAGPFDLKQGGKGIVGRLPIFNNNKFWGFSAVIIKLNTLLNTSGIDTSEESDYKVQISKINPHTNQQEFFLDQNKDLSFDQAETRYFSQGDWTLHIIPAHKTMANIAIFSLAGFGLLISVISGLFVTSILKKPAELQKLVAEQSIEIKKGAERNAAILNTLPDMLFILDKNGVFLDHHNPMNSSTIYPADFFLNKSVDEVMPLLLAKEILINIQDVMKNGNLLLHNYQLKGQDGVQHFEARYAKISDTEILSIVREKTREKQTEEEIMSMNLELRRLSDHLRHVREEERASLSRELHDELGQQLTAIRLDLHWLKKTLADADEKITSKINDAISIVSESANSVKRINTELRPSILDDLGLFAAMEWQIKDFSERYDIHCDLTCNCDHPQINPSKAIGVFRIIQESLNNIAKHAHASNVSIHGMEEGENFKIIITDDGIGFDEEEISKSISFGLLGMKERAKMLDGHVHINSKKGIGTTVEICFPLDSLNEEFRFGNKDSLNGEHIEQNS